MPAYAPLIDLVIGACLFLIGVLIMAWIGVDDG